jgi:hypothetical protein
LDLITFATVSCLSVSLSLAGSRLVLSTALALMRRGKKPRTHPQRMITGGERIL